MSAVPAVESMREYIERVRREHLPQDRYATRRQAEAEARELIASRVGSFDAAAISQFAKIVNRDLSRQGLASIRRWGVGLGQPNVNNLIRNLPATNSVIERLWQADAASVMDVYDDLRRGRAPGGDLLASLVLYLRDPSRYAVKIPATERGARALGILQRDPPVTYREFNDAVQRWRQEFDVESVETDIMLIVVQLGEGAHEIETTETPLRDAIETILADYLAAKTSEPFGSNASIWGVFEQLQLQLEQVAAASGAPSLVIKASPGSGNWANVPWAALRDNRAAASIRDGVYVVYLFRSDMTGVYLTLNQGVEEPFRRLRRNDGKVFLARRAEEIRSVAGDLAAAGFQLDNAIDLRSPPGLGSDYELSTIAHKFYSVGQVPEDSVLAADLAAVLRVYARYVERDRSGPAPSDWNARATQLEQAIQATGLVFEPWQLAAFVTAMRTKPFVILGGVTGTGKTQLPLLTARATGGVAEVIAVRPDWTDSSDLIGYTDLAGVFRPGPLLTFAATSTRDQDRLHLCVLDEMNIGRVEHYLAEVLSAIERREPAGGGGFRSAAFLPSAPDEWGKLGMPANFVLVGTVNMDESAHGFSRKVIDRAFTLELSDIDLSRVSSVVGDETPSEPWSANVFFPSALRLGDVADMDREYVASVVTSLSEANQHLAGAQLQVGYRSRDEIALFGLNARELAPHFVTSDGQEVDPTDLAITMKVLPRIIGGSAATRRALLGLLGWAHGAAVMRSDDDARGAVRTWETAGRPWSITDARYPRTAARLCLMWERLEDDGFASYWL